MFLNRIFYSLSIQEAALSRSEGWTTKNVFLLQGRTVILEKERSQELLNTYQIVELGFRPAFSAITHCPEEGYSDQEQVPVKLENQQADTQLQNQMINFNAKTAVELLITKSNIITIANVESQTDWRKTKS